MSAITITHTHADGTLIEGSAKGDGVALNDYERAHSPQAMAYDPESIWRDVIERLPNYDAARTAGFTDVSRFALTDGTVMYYDPQRPFTGPWGVEEPDPDDIECGAQDQDGWAGLPSTGGYSAGRD